MQFLGYFWQGQSEGHHALNLGGLEKCGDCPVTLQLGAQLVLTGLFHPHLASFFPTLALQPIVDLLRVPEGIKTFLEAHQADETTKSMGMCQSLSWPRPQFALDPPSNCVL